MEKTKTSWIDLYKKYGIYIFLVVVCAFFSVAAPNFLSASNLINILRQVSMFGIVVIGVTMVMIGGGMDLSVGGQMAVVGMVVGFLLVKRNLPIPVTVLVGILTGIAFGTVNGIVAIKLKIMPIIVTLSTMLILQGVAYLITGGYPITGMPKPFLTGISVDDFPNHLPSFFLCNIRDATRVNHEYIRTIFFSHSHGSFLFKAVLDRGGFGEI